jgi:hypothetical protein
LKWNIVKLFMSTSAVFGRYLFSTVHRYLFVC